MAAGASGLATAWAPAALAREGDEAKAERLLGDIARDLLVASPGLASGRGLDVGDLAHLRGEVGDYSAEGRRRRAAELTRRLGELDALPVERLSPDMRRHLEVVRYAYRSGLDGLSFPYGRVSVGSWLNSPYVVIQNVGAFIDVPRLLDGSHKLETAADADAYLSRLRAMAVALDGETEQLRAATAQGVAAPDFLLDKATRQIRQLRDGDPAGKRIVTRLTGAFPDREAAATRLFADAVVPALDRQLAALDAQRAGAASEAGVWRLPDGEAYYRWALEAATTTRRAPGEVHAQGLDELARLHGQMDALLRPLGYTDGTVGARMAALARDPRFVFPTGDAGRAQIIAYAQKSIDAIRPRLSKAFAKPGRGLVEIRRIPEAEELGAAGAYGGAGSKDGGVTGKFWINLRTTERWNRFNIPTLAYHEAIPGHVWQGEYTFDLPLVRTLLHYNAFNEGWGLYAEQIADEVGVYDDDPVARLGYLQSMAFRACRLVVDTGLHAKRWSREQAIAWFAEANGQAVDEVTSEVDRYCAWPGQACGYKVGHSEINRLRDHARASMGAAYDFRAFNDTVVGAGWMPLDVLGRVVEAYAAQGRG